jgi:hypothetical protein
MHVSLIKTNPIGVLMSDIEAYYRNFMQNLSAQAGADKNFTKSVFTETMCENLLEEAIVSNFSSTEYKDKNRGIAIDAWDYGEEQGLLTLIISDFREDPETLETLTKTELEANFKRISKFYEECAKGKLPEELDESMPVTELAYFIQSENKSFGKVSLIVVTNANLSDRVKSLPSVKISGKKPRTYVWDIGRLHRTEESGKGKEDIEIDLKQYSRDKKGLQCLPASGGAEGVESYLLAIPGDILADLYDEYGERLLEQNVRTFLQFRGKVNKGIRNTIINEPSMFFPYNNGISATAERVVTAGNARIVSIKNLQVVNGGQTTAAIFNAAKGKDKAPLKDVYVQMKLSLVPSKDVEVVVPKISEYANTQNKVNAADFFSNHPFHLRIEEISRRLWAKPAEGSTQQTHWFYERARGQFANAQTLEKTDSKKKKFLIANPRHQMFTKTDLAKYILTFEEKPHMVSLGAQKAFSGSAKAGGFIQHIIKQWDNSKGNDFSDLWFQRAIAKALLFRTLDKLVFKQAWYDSYRYKAQTVTYTLAKFSSMLRKKGEDLDYVKIWNEQKLETNLEEGLVKISHEVVQLLTSPPEYATKNIGEWAKKEDCWKIIEKEEMPFPEGIGSYLMSFSETTEREQDAARDRKTMSGIEQQAYIIEKGAEHWLALSEWNESNQKLTGKEQDILEIACRVPGKFPSDKQAPLLIKAEERAIEEGFFTG